MLDTLPLLISGLHCVKLIIELDVGLYFLLSHLDEILVIQQLVRNPLKDH